MKVTYDKPKIEPKYKLGDEFESNGKIGRLVRIAPMTIALLITSGSYVNTTWTWGVKVRNTRELTEEEVSKALGESEVWEQLNPREPESHKITLELESFDELKILWGRLNHNGSDLESSMKFSGITEEYTMKFNMWNEINELAIEFDLKDECGTFKE